MEDLISIIVPVYNVKDYLEECIKSILNQTYRNIEVIIVDDGSDDGSSAICDEYKKIDNRVAVIHQINKGLSAARNIGLSVCQGKYISFIDSDDYIEKNFIEVLYGLIKKNNVRVSLCQIKDLKNNTFTHGSTNLLNYSGEIIKGKDCILNTYVWNKLYDANIWKKHYFDIGKYYEDIYITYQIMYNEDKVAVSDKELYVYRKRAGSISSDKVDVNKTKDFLDASEQRMDFFESRDKYLYDVCINKYQGAIRQHYCALSMSDKCEFKDDMKMLVKDSRKLYLSRLFRSRFGFKSNIKNLFFIFFPNWFTWIQNKRNSK